MVSSGVDDEITDGDTGSAPKSTTKLADIQERMEVPRSVYLKYRTDVMRLAEADSIDISKPWSQQDDKIRRSFLKVVNSYFKQQFHIPLLIDLIQSVLQNSSRKHKLQTNLALKCKGITIKRGRPRQRPMKQGSGSNTTVAALITEKAQLKYCDTSLRKAFIDITSALQPFESQVTNGNAQYNTLSSPHMHVIQEHEIQQQTQEDSCQIEERILCSQPVSKDSSSESQSQANTSRWLASQALRRVADSPGYELMAESCQPWSQWSTLQTPEDIYLSRSQQAQESPGTQNSTQYSSQNSLPGAAQMSKVVSQVPSRLCSPASTKLTNEQSRGPVRSPYQGYTSYAAQPQSPYNTGYRTYEPYQSTSKQQEPLELGTQDSHNDCRVTVSPQRASLPLTPLIQTPPVNPYNVYTFPKAGSRDAGVVPASPCRQPSSSPVLLRRESNASNYTTSDTGSPTVIAASPTPSSVNGRPRTLTAKQLEKERQKEVALQKKAAIAAKKAQKAVMKAPAVSTRKR